MERTAYLYSTTGPEEIVGMLEREFESVGLSLQQGTSDRVMLLDEQGEQVESTKVVLHRCLHERTTTSFQWWRGDALDMYCRVRRLGEVTVVELAMSGFSDSEVRDVASVLKNVLCRDRGVIGMVFDPGGVTEDYDWDQFFAKNDHVEWQGSRVGIPEAIAVRKDDLKRLGELEGAVLSELGSLVVVSILKDPLG